jgi:hypothetical protein
MKKLMEKILQKIYSLIKRPKETEDTEEVAGLWMIE